MGERTFKGADGLRTLACLMVVFHHLSQQLLFSGVAAPAPLQFAADFFSSSGSAGVSVFFILSGFLLSLPFWRSYLDGGSLPDLRVYAVRRAGRIMPGFYLNLTFFFVLGLLFNPQAPAQLWRYFAGLTFTSGFHWLSFFPVEGNGPLWSIGFEVVSYLLMPVAMLGLFSLPASHRSLRTGLLWWAMVFLAVLAINQGIQDWFRVDETGKGWAFGLTGGAKFWMPRYNPVGFFAHFSLGIVGAAVAVAWSRATWSGRREGWFDAASFVLFAAWVALLVSRTNQDQFSWTIQGQPYYFPLFPGLSAALLACLSQSGIAGRIFDNRFTRYTAKISFGLYLWHTFVIEGFNGRIRDTLDWLILVAATLAVSYLIATLSWKFWEEPLLRRAQDWKPDQGKPSHFGHRWLMASTAAALLLVPLGLTLTLRPSAAAWPIDAQPVFSFQQPGPAGGLAFDGQGTAYTALNGNEIYRIHRDKTYQRLYSLQGAVSEVRLSFDRPFGRPLDDAVPGLGQLRPDDPWIWGIRLGPDGNLYVAAGTKVLVLTVDGQLVREKVFTKRGRFGVMDLVFDAEGRVLVADGDAVFRWDTASDDVSTYLDGQATGFALASGLVLTADGKRLFVCDFEPRDRGACRIFEFATSNLAKAQSVVAAAGVVSGAELPTGDMVFSASFTSGLWKWQQGRVTRLECLNLGTNGVIVSSSAWGPGLYAAGWDGNVSRVPIKGGSL